MAKQLIVTASLVVAKRGDGSDVYLYAGAPVPDGLKDGEVERFQELGFVAELEDEASKPLAKKAASSNK